MALTHEEIVNAIRNLRPGASYAVRDSVIEWRDDSQTQPSTSELEAEDAKTKKAYTDNKYQRDRAAEYPSVVDQLDDIYHNGIDAWKATIKTTKDKYPKS